MTEIITHEEYRAALATCIAYKEQVLYNAKKVTKQVVEIMPSEFEQETLLSKIKLPSRVKKVFINKHELLDLPPFHMATIKDLNGLRISDIKRFRNLGDSSVKKFIEICEKYNVTLTP